MVLLDVNVLVNAMREDAPRHDVVRAYIESLRASPEPFGLSDVALSGAIRVLTHPRVFNPPTPSALARDFISALRASSNAVMVAPGTRHWRTSTRRCQESHVVGNLVSRRVVAPHWPSSMAVSGFRTMPISRSLP